MKLSRLTIYLVILAVVGSMAGLVFVQLRIFKEDVAIYEEKFNLTVPEYFNTIYEEMRYDKGWVDMVNAYEGGEFFSFESFEKAPDNMILKVLKMKIDSVFARHNMNIAYRVNGLIASDTECFFYSDSTRRAENPNINLVTNAENFLCLCGPDVGRSHGDHGDGKYTAFDISFSYPNFIAKNASMLRATVLLLLVIIAAFSYTVITINRQKKLSQLKNDFINNLTHEFKTPIFSIALASGLLRKSDEVRQSDKLSKYAELIDNEGKRLKSQVDKILQMALIDSGNFKLDKKELDLHELIEKVTKAFELIINERNGRLILDLGARQHFLIADETHLNNIIYNLLDNAVKYTEGEPEIKVITRDTDKGIELIIQDNGIGMGEEVQKFIFDKFYRAESGNLHNVKVSDLV
ncbi:sensor histidine kinase [Roseivirga sp.]|uniref:sensor histidine kinase n=1 Tax=Roseivirga sp. TaxID=1964215 RepID=UPI003B5170EB